MTGGVMKFLAGIGTVLLVAGLAFAQERTFGSPSGFGNILYPGTGQPPVRQGLSGFGNIAFPGTGRAPQARLPFSITNTCFANRLGGIVSGFNPYRGNLGGGRGSSVVYMPYAYPVYMGGYDVMPQQQPNVVVVYPAQQAPVVINQHFQQPAPPPAEDEATSIKVYQAPSRSPEDMAAAAAQPSPGYPFAFKDHSIYSSVAYWVEGDTLHYFTSGNVHNQVSMSLLDRPLTLRLNKERGVDVRFPEAR